MAGNSGEPGRTVTSKLAAILTAFTSGSNHTLSELSMQTNLAVSTLHRLLNDLVSHLAARAVRRLRLPARADSAQPDLRAAAADPARASSSAEYAEPAPTASLSRTANSIPR